MKMGLPRGRPIFSSTARNPISKPGLPNDSRMC